MERQRVTAPKVGTTSAIYDSSASSGFSKAAARARRPLRSVGVFGAPQQLSADTTGASQQHPVLAAGGSLTDVAWVTPAGPVVAQAASIPQGG
jgi:hypothetical protein